MLNLLLFDLLLVYSPHQLNPLLKNGQPLFNSLNSFHQPTTHAHRFADAACMRTA